MAGGGVGRHGVGAQLDDKQNRPKGAEEHRDRKLVPERDSHGEQPVEFDHLRCTVTMEVGKGRGGVTGYEQARQKISIYSFTDVKKSS